MEDNNTCNKNHSVDCVNRSISFLKYLYSECEEELNGLEINRKNYSELLKEKENILSENKKELIPNIDVFSPIYKMPFDSSADINREINVINEYIDKSDKYQLKLAKRKESIEDTLNCINYLINSSLKNSDQSKGLNILEAQEKDRQRIAGELHDSTVQNLTSLVHKTELCIRLMDIDAIRAKLELITMSNTVKTIINDMRNIIFNLKPMTLSDLGLNLTIEHFINQLEKENDIKVRFTHNDDIKNLKPVINTTIFRIIKESCCNVIKHAKATLIDINIVYNDNNIEVTVKDNGIGFDIKKINYENNKSNFGLSIMKERIALLSGSLQIQSEKGKGTIIKVKVPVSINKEDEDDKTY